jgi:hypothetical protein
MVTRVQMMPGYVDNGTDEDNIAASTADIVTLMRRKDEFGRNLYETNPSYRLQVEEEIAKSMVGNVSNANAAGGRFQATPQVIHDAPPVERELTDHEKEMLSKAQKHGF